MSYEDWQGLRILLGIMIIELITVSFAWLSR